jgi:hypothetical protein
VEGYAALYHGYRATLLRDVPFSAFQFAFYGTSTFMANVVEKFKLYAHVYQGTKDGTLSLWLECVVGATAGSLAGALTTPLDVMKTIMQTQIRPTQSINTRTDTPKVPVPSASATPKVTKPLESESRKTTRYFHGVRHGLQWTWKHEGLSGLFRGFAPRIFITGAQSTVMFLIYEEMLQVLRKRQ